MRRRHARASLAHLLTDDSRCTTMTQEEGPVTELFERMKYAKIHRCHDNRLVVSVVASVHVEGFRADGQIAETRVNTKLFSSGLFFVFFPLFQPILVTVDSLSPLRQIIEDSAGRMSASHEGRESLSFLDSDSLSS